MHVMPAQKDAYEFNFPLKNTIKKCCMWEGVCDVSASAVAKPLIVREHLDVPGRDVV